MVFPVALPGLLLIASLASAADRCEGVREAPPRDPFTCECFRQRMEPRGAAALVEERLRGWLARAPDDPWILAALGGHHVEHDPAVAREALGRALAVFESRDDRMGEAYVRLLRARDHQRHRRVGALRYEVARAESRMRGTRDPVLEAWLRLLRCNELTHASRSEELLDLVRATARAPWFPSLPASLQGSLLTQGGFAARAIGRYSEAIVFARRAAAALGDCRSCRAEEAYDLAETTRLMADAGLASRADVERRAREAYAAARGVGHTYGEVFAACTLGAWGRLPESLEWDRVCEERAGAANCPDLRFRAQLRRAEGAARLDRARIHDSVRAVERLLEEQRRLPTDADGPATTLRVLSRLHAMAGRRREAIAALEQAIAAHEELRALQTDAEARASALARAAPYAYELAGMLALADESPDPERAHEVLEWFRARAILDSTGRPARVSEIQRTLHDDEAMVLLQLPPPDASPAWALVLTIASRRVVRLDDFDVGAALPLYLGAIERRTDPPAPMSNAVREALLTPVLEVLPPAVRRIVVVPDGPVARLPLAALPDPRTGRPLVERFELSLVPSATAWLARRTTARPLAPAALGVGEIERGDRAALPRSGPEVRAMTTAIGGASVGLFADRASEAALERLDLAPFGVVHFATHAVLNVARPERSAIVLARGDGGGDGLLQAGEIARLPLRGKLVVLSACRTADGRETRGEGPLSLARAFLGAGAGAVIGAVWPVRDREAAALFERFYHRLGRGEPAAAALAGAQRELLAGGAPPAAWAGFVLIGDGDVALAAMAASERPASPAVRVSLAALAALAAAAAVAALVRRARRDG